MIRYSLNLPRGIRLDLSLVKRRGVDEAKPVLPRLKDIGNIRNGSKISRYFRHIFEHKKINKILGANFAVLTIATTLIPNQTGAFNNEDNNSIIKPEIVLVTQKGIQNPLKNIRVTQGYRMFHPGTDFDATTGDPVYPVMNGVVEAVNYSKVAYGNAVIVNHGNEITSLYAHLSKINVKVSDEVNLGTVIGKAGATGRASGDHLHLEVRDHGIPFNPSLILPKSN